MARCRKRGDESRRKRRFAKKILAKPVSLRPESVNISAEFEHRARYPSPATDRGGNRPRARARAIRVTAAYCGRWHGDGVGGARQGHAWFSEDRRRQDDALEAQRGRAVRA